MKFFDKNPVVVQEHETALQVYLDALLQDMSHSVFTVEPQRLIQQEILEKNDALKPAVITNEIAIVKCMQENRVPDWAATSFQCLLVSSNGVKLAIPLTKLHGIVNLTESLALVPGYASWFLGLLSWRGTHVKVIDIYKLMAMENNELVSFKESVPKRVVLAGDGSWGFTCDDVSRIITLCSDQIQWRADRTHRAWLVGVVIEHMCSLLDMDGFSIPARIMPANCCEDAAFIF